MNDIQAAYAGDDLRSAEARARGAGPEGALMQRAAAGLAAACVRALRASRGRVAGSRVVILAGTGDNGGDGLFAGARLRGRGVAVDAVLIGGTAHPEGVWALTAAGGRVLTLADENSAARASSQLATADLVLDAIAGLKGRPGLRPGVAMLLAAVNPRAVLVAVDLPSGVDPETGETPAEHVRADRTVTFGAIKVCLLVPPATHAAGQIELVDIGLSAHLSGAPVIKRLTERDVARAWPAPALTDHKYTRGVLGVVAGSRTYPGAAVMTCLGAIRAGVGIVKYTGPSSVAAAIIAARPEVLAHPGRVNAYALGPGVSDEPTQDAAIQAALESGLPCVVDAGALQPCVAARAAGRRAAAGERILLTPHAGELARLLGLVGVDVTREEVEARPWHYAHQLARAIDVTVLVKGPTTLVVPPDGLAYSQADGTPWMATGGSGDVLTGVAGALMASGLTAPIAGALAAHVHGRAGVRASRGGPVAPADLADAVSAVIAELLVTMAAPGGAGRKSRGAPAAARIR